MIKSMLEILNAAGLLKFEDIKYNGVPKSQMIFGMNFIKASWGLQNYASTALLSQEEAEILEEKGFKIYQIDPTERFSDSTIVGINSGRLGALMTGNPPGKIVGDVRLKEIIINSETPEGVLRENGFNCDGYIHVT